MSQETRQTAPHEDEEPDTTQLIRKITGRFRPKSRRRPRVMHYKERSQVFRSERVDKEDGSATIRISVQHYNDKRLASPGIGEPLKVYLKNWSKTPSFRPLYFSKRCSILMLGNKVSLWESCCLRAPRHQHCPYNLRNKMQKRAPLPGNSPLSCT